VSENAVVDGAQVEGGAPDPVGERRAVETNALPLVNLGLAIQRQVLGVFGDDDVSDRRVSRHAPSISRDGALDWMTPSSQERHAYLGGARPALGTGQE
jgi:hypothetical protein